MSAMSDYLENKLVDHIFRGRQMTAPTNLYVALFTTTPSDSGGGTEVSGGSYARTQVACSDTNWKGTHGSADANPSSGTGGNTKNAIAITFPQATANWGTVYGFAIFDASSGGNMITYGSLSSSKTINSGDTATFAVDSLSFTLA